MSDQGANIEKLLERYVIGDLTDSDRELVELYLTGSGVDAARAREDLRLEQHLMVALDLPSEDVAIADAVLSRVFQRPLPENRKSFKPNEALSALMEAKESGRIVETRHSFLSARVRRLATFAACLAVFVGAMWMNASMNRAENDFSRTRGGNLVIDNVASVAFLEESAANKIDGIPQLTFEPKNEVVLAGDDIKTNQGEAALIRLKSGGVIYVHQLSRIQIIRDEKGQKPILKVMEGALHYDFRNVNGAVAVQSSEGHHGRLTGVGHISWAPQSMPGIDRPAMASSLGQILLVRVKSQGHAVFNSASGHVKIQVGQLGVVSPGTVVAVPDSKRSGINSLDAKTWSLKGVIRDHDQPAMQVAQRTLTREDVVHEALRVFEFDLIDMLATTFVVETEMKILGCEPSLGEIADASRFVENDELMQILPLRSADAQRARARQIAGLMAINRTRRAARKLDLLEDSIPQVRQRVWQELRKNLVVERKNLDGLIAFRVGYRNQKEEIAKTQAWNRLRRLLRRSEFTRMVKRLSEKTILDIWLENRKLNWPPQPDAANFPYVAVAQMAGLTRVQLLDLLQIENLVMQNTQPPNQTVVERFMKDKVSKRRQLDFDHYFFPTTDPFRGAPYDQKRSQSALARAEALVAKLRRGEKPEESDIRATVPRYGNSLWKNGTFGGPRPWWNEIYGRQFTYSVMNLSVGQISNPIRSSEGYHVVALRHEGEDKSDPRSHKSYAQMMFRFELARRQFESEVAGKTKLLQPLEDILK